MATRAGMVMSLRRIVAVVALARLGPVMVAAALDRLKAMTARTNHAEFAVKTLEVIWSRSHRVHDVHDEGVLLMHIALGESHCSVARQTMWQGS